MDIFVRNIPTLASTKQVEAQFREPFAEFGITVFHCDKKRYKPLATFTVLDRVAAQRFLSVYGVPQNSPPSVRAQNIMKWDRKVVQISKSRTEPSRYSLKALELKESQQASKAAKSSTAPAATETRSHKRTLKFDIDALGCGVWDYSGSDLAFTPHYTCPRSGTVTFGINGAVILLHNSTSSLKTRLDITYHNCENIILCEDNEDPTVTFTLNISPRIYEAQDYTELINAMTRMAFVNVAQIETPKKTRVLGIDEHHAKVAGVCHAYRLTLSNLAAVNSIRRLLRTSQKGPPFIVYHTLTKLPPEKLMVSLLKLNYELTEVKRFGSEPFSIRFQLSALAMNGILPPLRVRELIPKVRELLRDHGTDVTSAALRRFGRQIPRPGPELRASELSTSSLIRLLDECVSAYDRSAPNNPYELAKRHVHIKLIHRVIITPTGTYLEGPEPETANRVLRNWADHTDHFIRVVFQDEDGGSVRYDPRANQNTIFKTRFQGVLDGSILIAGQGFSFLGFSHSSLRAQSCWFMAPFAVEGDVWYGARVLKQLGDFSSIRVPAKCAARIGQNFSDTNATLDLEESQLGWLDKVTRNGRDFSDGVGTISRDLLSEVWKVYGARRLLRPTALQIRFQGAKGMVSLDSRLKGKKLMLRENMKKFETHNSWTLEICNAAFRPMAMILNRQFIKILEDLNVPVQVFMDLQREAVEKLSCMITAENALTCAVNTATLLEDIEYPRATKLSSLIELLGAIGLDYRQDKFLYGVVEMGVVSMLRDIKYRGRIPVPDGVTLYGIMDETGYLAEGEVYVVTEKGPEGGRHVVKRDKVCVTRSPAMHPGDIQIARAVDVPVDSPLKELSNVIVFSQYGYRDLPSQLGGGDLDGDLYNVIYDQRLIPSFSCEAANYPSPPVLELDRQVEIKDMSDFFVKFMESDVLGMLCTIHLQLADQEGACTFSANCIKLAQLASTAVDFSKTGTPVDMNECPRYERLRPDYMATSPRVIMSDQGHMDIEDDDNEEVDEITELDAETLAMRYYESTKILGRLFRNIDERRFLESMNDEQRVSHNATTSYPLTRLLNYMQYWAKQYGIGYEHHLNLVRDIRAGYDDNLADLAYIYTPSNRDPLSEMEVFAGQILGRQGGVLGKPLRELSLGLREKLNIIADYTTARIIYGDQVIESAEDLDDLDEVYDERENEALPRAIACLTVAMQNQGGYFDRRLRVLESFKYIAAAVCLEEFRRYRSKIGAYNTLPPVDLQ